MIVVYPFSLKDQDLALENAKWINELGGCKGHQCVMLADHRCSQPDLVLGELEKAFDKVTVLSARATIDGWPEGANYFFRLAANWMEGKHPSFFWMEPDAIPICEHWLDILVQEYKACGKPFMGDRVQVGDIPLHMSGVGFYPCPLHKFAGEAYRAAEVAWDMAGRQQIVPNAHWTIYIEHAWKHPEFTRLEELDTQIRPEAVLFHASKDGSLIRLLRLKRNSPALSVPQESPGSPDLLKHIPGEATAPSGRQDAQNFVPEGYVPNGLPLSGKETLASILPKPEKDREEPRSPSPEISCDIFIRTYPGDYEWLYWCLCSIQKFCCGFRKVLVCSPAPPPNYWTGNDETWDWRITPDETEDGYLAQQITKMYADVLTDYQPDFILHLDSDTMFTRPTTPGDFMHHDRVMWPFTPYAAIETPWQPIVGKFMGHHVDNEFMRRFPIVIPRWLYPRIREFCHKQHGVIISEYIKHQPLRHFSEFNALGAYAFQYHFNMFAWINTVEEPQYMPPLFARQFHSWGGISTEVRAELNSILTNGEQVTESALHSGDGAPGVPAGVKQLPNGIWVIEGDTHIGKWVEQEQRVDHDMNTLPFILPLIEEGSIVVDVGANIGDHTIAYMKKARFGHVYAFEPCQLAMQCLMHNVAREVNQQWSFFHAFNVGLGAKFESLELVVPDGNYGAAFIHPNTNGSVRRTAAVIPLDSLELAPDFIKIDAEGYEVFVLMGAVETIRKHWPTMVIEMNEGALARYGFNKQDITNTLDALGYTYTVMQENCTLDSPMFDLIALPPEVGRRPVAEMVKVVSTDDTDTSVSEPLEQSISLQEHVAALANHARKGKEPKKYVRKLLFRAGVVEPTPKRK